MLVACVCVCVVSVGAVVIYDGSHVLVLLLSLTDVAVVVNLKRVLPKPNRRSQQ